MKSYEQLREIAEIYTKHVEKIPNNPLKLANQLQIKCKTKIECINDFKKMCPLYSVPAILCNFGSEQNPEHVIYYDETSRFWNFYIFHELAHYILEHNSDSPDNEQEANMLACLLIAPTNKIPSYFNGEKDLSNYANIPIGRAEEYWSKINNSILCEKQKNFVKKIVFSSVFIILITIGIVFLYNTLNTYNKKDIVTETISTESSTTTTIEPVKDLIYDNQNTEIENKTQKEEMVYVTETGEKYHKIDCFHIKNRETTELTLTEVQKKYEPCKDCFSK